MEEDGKGAGGVGGDADGGEKEGEFASERIGSRGDDGGRGEQRKVVAQTQPQRDQRVSFLRFPLYISIYICVCVCICVCTGTHRCTAMGDGNTSPTT